MSDSLTQQQQERIRRKVEAGLYASPEEAVDEALDLLDEQDDELARELDEARQKVREGIARTREGRYAVYDEQGLNELRERIKREGRERRAENVEHHRS